MSNGISTAIGSGRLASVSGYEIQKGSFGSVSPNLPQNILVIGAPGSDSVTKNKTKIESAEQAAEIYGRGSYMHRAFKKLYPTSSDILQGIPTYAICPEMTASSSQVKTVFLTGTATKDFVITARLNEESQFDGVSLSLRVKKGQDQGEVVANFKQLFASAIDLPATISDTPAPNGMIFTGRSVGITSYLALSFEFSESSTGISLALLHTSSPTGTASLSDLQKTQIGSDWHTIVVTQFTELASVLTEMNGNPENKQGNHTPYDFKPFAVFIGTSSTTESVNNYGIQYPNESTICICPQPGGPNATEIAAKFAAVAAPLFQESPHLDISGKNTGQSEFLEGTDYYQSSYANRDTSVKTGASTSIWIDEAWRIEDFVTSYNPQGEKPFQFSYLRNLMIDWNIKYGYDALEKLYVRNHVIIKSGQSVSASKTVSPEQWKAILYGYWDELAQRALITEPEFSKAGTFVEVDAANPNRFNTLARYKRSGFARIESTTVQTGF